MKIDDVRALPNDELKDKLYALEEELFNLRRKKAVGQLEHGEQVHAVRKDIARIKTVLKERELLAKANAKKESK